jgi:hypothetical protein
MRAQVELRQLPASEPDLGSRHRQGVRSLRKGANCAIRARIYMTSPSNGDVVTAHRPALDHQPGIDGPQESNEDSLGSFPSEEERTVSLTVPPISTAWVAFPSRSAITASAFACGLAVGISVMWLAGVPGHAPTEAARSVGREGASQSTDGTRSQQPQHEPAPLLVPTVVPIRGNSSDARVDPHDVQLETPAAKPPAKSGVPRFRGVIVVNSRPSGARVFLNGRSVGTTPLVLKNQTAGSRAVRLTLDGYDSWTSAVRVVADTETRLRAELKLQQPPQP